MAVGSEVQSTSNISTTDLEDEPTQFIDYKYLYDELLKNHEKLKTQFTIQEKKILSFKESDATYKNINENLRSQIKDLQKNLNVANLQLKKMDKSTEKQIKFLSQNKTRTIATQAKQLLSSVFTKNQLDLIMKKKKRVNWSREEILKAFTLRYFSKRSYVYIRDELNYPLPGK